MKKKIKKPRLNIEKGTDFYYTNEEMVKALLAIVPINGSVLDAGSGRNKVWFNNLGYRKYECEIEDGCDYYKWSIKVDWVVGNPPWQHEGKNQVWNWIKKASEISNVGFAFLLNHKVFNTLTPVRLKDLADKGFYIQRIKIISDKRWFGRYYFIIWQKNKNDFVLF